MCVNFVILVCVPVSTVLCIVCTVFLLFRLCICFLTCFVCTATELQLIIIIITCLLGTHEDKRPYHTGSLLLH
jgi:hypothetical protein